MRYFNKGRGGFTVLEVTLVVTIMALFSVLLFATLNPVRIGAEARDRQRVSDVNSLLNIAYENIVDNGGAFSCVSGALPTSTTNLASSGGYDIAPCLIPDYTSALPYDPSASSSYFAGVNDYDLGYSIAVSTTTGKMTISAPHAEGDNAILVTR